MGPDRSSVSSSPAFSSLRAPSEGESLALDLYYRNNPTNWRLTEELLDEEGRKVRRREISGFDTGQRVILRKDSAGGDVTFSGGWFGPSGISPLVALSEEEAADLYQRINDQAKSWMRRELVRFINSDLSSVLSDIPKQSWMVTPRWASVEGDELIGYLAQAEGTFTDGRNDFQVTIEAAIDQDAEKTYVKVALERRGFTVSSYLGEEREGAELSAICARCGLIEFHRMGDATLPPVPNEGEIIASVERSNLEQPEALRLRC